MRSEHNEIKYFGLLFMLNDILMDKHYFIMDKMVVENYVSEVFIMPTFFLDMYVSKTKKFQIGHLWIKKN